MLTADRNGGLAADEDLMTPKLPTVKFPIVKFAAARALAVLLAAVAVLAVGFQMTPADAATKPRPTDDRGRPYYGPNGPNVSYQQGPHTRIYVTKRSWLDAGVEVLPGDRKFSDYAFPQGPAFNRNINNRSIDRQPLNPPSDMGGYPLTIPLP